MAFLDPRSIARPSLCVDANCGFPNLRCRPPLPSISTNHPIARKSKGHVRSPRRSGSDGGQAAELLDVSHQAAANNTRKLEEAGILEDIAPGPPGGAPPKSLGGEEGHRVQKAALPITGYKVYSILTREKPQQRAFDTIILIFSRHPRMNPGRAALPPAAPSLSHAAKERSPPGRPR